MRLEVRGDLCRNDGLHVQRSIRKLSGAGYERINDTTLPAPLPITRNSFEVRSSTGTVVLMHSERPSNVPTLSSSPSETRKEKRTFRRFPVELTSLCSADGLEWSGTAVNLS